MRVFVLKVPRSSYSVKHLASATHLGNTFILKFKKGPNKKPSRVFEVDEESEAVRWAEAITTRMKWFKGLVSRARFAC